MGGGAVKLKALDDVRRSSPEREAQALIEEARRRQRRRRGSIAVVLVLIAAALFVVVGGSGGSHSHRSRGDQAATSARNTGPIPTPPSNAIVFAKATSDGLDARIEIAYVSGRDGAVVSLAKASKHGMVAAEPRWSPDGSQVAFVMSPRGHLTRFAGDGDIYLMNANGTGIRRLTHGLDASDPVWSPDGSRIAFIKGQGQALAVMQADGSGQHVIARARGYYENPAWSPDGQTIAYQSSPNGNIDVTAIYTIRPDGSLEHQLTPAAASAGFPAWSPDGSRIAYSARDQLWLMNSNGTAPRRLTNCRLPCVFDFAPAWSPNGSDLVFVQQGNGGATRRLYTLDLATATVKQLTPDIRWAGSPDWRP